MKSHSFQTSRWPLACAFLCAMGALFASASPHAAAGEEEATFNIGVQSLNEALIEFGKQTGLSISVDSKTLSGKRSSAVNGSMSLDRAIDKMLEGTGLEHSISGNMLTLREAASGLINLRSARLVGDLASGLTDSDAFSVVEEDVIANQQGSTAVDVFNEMAGVVGINEGGRQTFRINIRGLEGSGRVAIDVDGAQMNQIDHNHGFATNRVLIEPSLIKQVSVVRGPASNKRGGGALAGSVSFTTINPADLFRGGASVGGFFKAGYEENGNGFNSSLGLARRASEKWSFLGAFTYRSYESYEDAEGVEVIASGSRSNSTLLKAVFDASEDQSIKLAYRGEEHNYNGSGAFARGQLRSSNIQDETVDTDTFSIHYTHEGSGQDWLNLNANAYVTDNLRIEQDLDSDSESMDDLRTKGFNVVNSASIFGDAFGSELTYGFDYFKDDLAASSSSPAGERSQYGVFIDGYHKINDSLVVFEGLRFDDFDMSSADGDDLSGDNLSGRIGFELSPFNSSESLENLTFFANYGTGFRTPTLREAFLSSDPSTGRRSRPGLLPNPDLGPETSNTWEAGIQHSVTGVFQGGDRLRFRAAFYDQTLEDGLVAVVSEVPNYNTTVNLEEHSLYGLEFEASYDSELFFYRLTYDRRVREELGDGLPGDPIQNQPWSVFSNLGFRLMDGRLTLGMEHRHVTDYSETSLEDTDDNANTIARLFRPSFDLFNLYAQYRVNDHLLVNARVDNAADELYQAYQTLDAGMGRNAKISAEFRW